MSCKRLPPNWDNKRLPCGSDDDDKDVGYYMSLAKEDAIKEANELAEDIADIIEDDVDIDD